MEKMEDSAQIVSHQNSKEIQLSPTAVRRLQKRPDTLPFEYLTSQMPTRILQPSVSTLGRDFSLLVQAPMPI